MYKNYTNNKPPIGGGSNILLNIHWLVLVLIVIIMQLGTTASAQKITLTVKGASLKSVFTELHKQSKYHFLYTNEQLRNGKPVTINVNSVELKIVLDQVFSNQPLTYTINGKSVVIQAKLVGMVEKPIVAPVNKAVILPVTGVIHNASGAPLEGVSIHVKGSTLGTVTGINGHFYLELPNDAVLLHITCIGYIPIEIGFRKTADGYTAYTTTKDQSQYLNVIPGHTGAFSLHLQSSETTLSKVIIKVDKPLGTTVDLVHRSHLNLAQVLDGSVPGLTLKQSITTTSPAFFGRNDSGVGDLGNLQDNYNYNKSKYQADGYPDFNSWLKKLQSDPKVSVTTGTVTTNNGLVPELRGATTFTGNTSGMLVVIDGFAQDGFPSNYPMSNVASVEVIRDPVELIKWGPRATGGIVMVTTKGAQAGKLQVNYSSNYYYNGPPDNSAKKLQLASTADVLSYYKEQVVKGLASYILSETAPSGLKPAQQLLYDLYHSGGDLTNQTPAFMNDWDALFRLSNRGQLRLLQQNAFSQNQNLMLSGGSKAYRFSVNGTYGNTTGNNLGSNSRNLGLNLQNNLSLFQNKFRLSWLLNGSSSKSQAGAADNGQNLDPYQMLLNPQGGYVYNYSVTTPDQNKALAALGYPGYGNNALQDARENSSISKTFTINSRLNLNWELAKGLRWSTSFNYINNTGSNSNLEGAASSQARMLVSNYGAPVYNDPAKPGIATGVDYYVPPGAIFTKSTSSSKSWDLRSGLSYIHNFDAKNVLSATLGTAASSVVTTSTPYPAIYGYNAQTGEGLPFLMAPAGGIINYFGVSEYSSTLHIPGLNGFTTTRNVAVNGSLNYDYDNRYSLSTQYGAVYVPEFGSTPPYSVTANYSTTGSWRVNRERFFKLPWISTLMLSVTAGEMRVSKLPPAITASRTQQSDWNNAFIYVTGFDFSQQNGQVVRNVGGSAQLGLWHDIFYLQAGYNHPSTGGNQLSGLVRYNIAKEPWFHVRGISSLTADVSLQDISATQALAIMMGTNTPNSGGGFSTATNTNFSLLPPDTRNIEAHLTLGLDRERYIIDLRYYRKSSSGYSTVNAPTDPTSGVSTHSTYNQLLNKGVELYLQAKLIKHRDFNWTATVTGAYNMNLSLGVPMVNFSQDVSYMTAVRSGYSLDNLWSFKWAGLDNQGNPQVYDAQHRKVTVSSTTPLDASYMTYSGKTRAPWSGALIQEWDYKNFFITARVVVNLGNVMRTYIPVAGPTMDNNYLIADRWKKPGDEAYTDIPVMAPTDLTRTLVIQNSSNSIVSADNIRLREVQLGYELPEKLLKGSFIKTMSISTEMENIALWTRNKLGVDPNAISSTGIMSTSLPKQYVLSLNMSF
ncbi:SusC/RagA family TonB-linked outer membrane protein [Pedobacter nutrimenti]|uniref:SusC/RagA family TonB-linked outer membrane protein n=1 Tax=Pedobacter nutrimenti TaxID=1241337 RepID=UPI00292E0789|nr:carboxypeptidase-like regulatory domain-containing protein [Pedobacter nutrimenti]